MNKCAISAFLLWLLIFNSSTSFSQNSDCNCESDLDFLHTKLLRTPAYKVNKKAYELAFSETLEQIKKVNNAYDCFLLLNRLTLALNDNHIKIYESEKEKPSGNSSESELSNKKEGSLTYADFPKPNVDMDSLRVVLKEKGAGSVEGIYYGQSGAELGVYHDQEKDLYRLIVLKTESPVWEVGEVMYSFIPYGYNNYLAVGGVFTTKRFIAFTERIENGILHRLKCQKDISKPNYSHSLFSDSTYVRQELSTDITYLKIGSFSSYYPTLSDAEAFYAALENSLTKKQLIIDLRGNTGGGDRNSDILFKILKSYVKSNKISIITNQRTASNAEQFTQRMKHFSNVTTFGARTSGTAAYEIKNSIYNLPCEGYTAILTSKKHAQYLDIESRGVEPDIKLDYRKNWLEQVKMHLSNQ